LGRILKPAPLHTSPDFVIEAKCFGSHRTWRSFSTKDQRKDPELMADFVVWDFTRKQLHSNKVVAKSINTETRTSHSNIPTAYMSLEGVVLPVWPFEGSSCNSSGAIQRSVPRMDAVAVAEFVL
jgi:hypothetical protein